MPLKPGALHLESPIPHQQLAPTNYNIMSEQVQRKFPLFFSCIFFGSV